VALEQGLIYKVYFTWTSAMCPWDPLCFCFTFLCSHNLYILICYITYSCYTTNFLSITCCYLSLPENG